MKKIYFILACLFAGVATSYADIDETVVFTIGSGGEALEDGYTLTVSDVTEDELLGNYINSGLYVKNTDSSVNNYLAIQWEVESLPSGFVQLCFPMTCDYGRETGTYTTGIGIIRAGEERSLQSEWCLDSYGTCTVTYTILLYNSSTDTTPSAQGPSVTVNFVYSADAAVNVVENNAEEVSTEYFDLSGRRVNAPQSGLVIKKSVLSDGTAKSEKVIF